jgi:hypothetical protein
MDGLGRRLVIGCVLLGGEQDEGVGPHHLLDRGDRLLASDKAAYSEVPKTVPKRIAGPAARAASANAGARPGGAALDRRHRTGAQHHVRSKRKLSVEP